MDRAAKSRSWVTESCVGRIANGGLGTGRRAGTGSVNGLSRLRASLSSRVPRSRTGCHAFPPSASRRNRKREATVGEPPRLAARDSTTLPVPIAMVKSWAVWPMRRSGGVRPSSWRIGRLRKASVGAAGGHTVSSRPPSSTTSAATRRASSRPRICRRGCG